MYNNNNNSVINKGMCVLAALSMSYGNLKDM